MNSISMKEQTKSWQNISTLKISNLFLINALFPGISVAFKTMYIRIFKSARFQRSLFLNLLKTNSFAHFFPLTATITF